MLLFMEACFIFQNIKLKKDKCGIKVKGKCLHYEIVQF